MRAGVEPGEAAPHCFDAEHPGIHVVPRKISDLQLAAREGVSVAAWSHTVPSNR